MIVYFDTETTGLMPGKICQLSYVMQTKDKTVGKNFFFSVPFVEPGAYAVHGFSVGKLKELSRGKVFSDFIDEIDKDFSSADMIVAHNVSFDLMFLRAEFENCGRVFTYNDSLCSMKASTPVCKLFRTNHLGYKYPKLSEMAEYFGVEEYDVKEAMEWLFGANADFHDARFDSTVVYLAMKRAMRKEEKFFILEEKL